MERKMDKAQADKLKNNIRQTQKGNRASRYGQQGLTSKATKMNSANFKKLMTQRNLSGFQTKQAWDSFRHSKRSPVMARHASKGENFKMTSGKKNASGIYLSKKALGKNPMARINKGALPPGNSATRQANVKLAKNQNVVYGKIAPQPSFQKKDAKGLPRKGGGMQTITNGGFKSNAVKMSKNLSRQKYAGKAAKFTTAKSAGRMGISGGKSSGKSAGAKASGGAAKSASASKGQSR